MKTFEEEYEKYENLELPISFYTDEIIREFKDWQPPTEKVVVPQFVADWFEKNKDDLEFNIFDVNTSIWDKAKQPGTLSEIEKWFNRPYDKPIETVIRMEDGYTVEKEKKFWLKNRMTNLFLLEVISTNEPTHFQEVANEDDDIIRDDGALIMQFTQQEIDNMETGSYEQIEVEE